MRVCIFYLNDSTHYFFYYIIIWMIDIMTFELVEFHSNNQPELFISVFFTYLHYWYFYDLTGFEPGP